MDRAGTSGNEHHLPEVREQSPEEVCTRDAKLSRDSSQEKTPPRQTTAGPPGSPPCQAPDSACLLIGERGLAEKVGEWFVLVTHLMAVPDEPVAARS